MDLNPKQLDKFFSTFEPILAEGVKAQPALYRYELHEVPVIVQRLRAAVERRGSFTAVTKDTPTVRQTCKALGIRSNTYKAIDAFLREGL